MLSDAPTVPLACAGPDSVHVTIKTGTGEAAGAAAAAAVLLPRYATGS